MIQNKDTQSYKAAKKSIYKQLIMVFKWTVDFVQNGNLQVEPIIQSPDCQIIKSLLQEILIQSEKNKKKIEIGKQNIQNICSQLCSCSKQRLIEVMKNLLHLKLTNEINDQETIKYFVQKYGNKIQKKFYIPQKQQKNQQSLENIIQQMNNKKKILKLINNIGIRSLNKTFKDKYLTQYNNLHIQEQLQFNRQNCKHERNNQLNLNNNNFDSDENNQQFVLIQKNEQNIEEDIQDNILQIQHNYVEDESYILFYETEQQFEIQNQNSKIEQNNQQQQIISQKQQLKNQKQQQHQDLILQKQINQEEYNEEEYFDFQQFLLRNNCDEQYFDYDKDSEVNEQEEGELWMFKQFLQDLRIQSI